MIKTPKFRNETKALTQVATTGKPTKSTFVLSWLIDFQKPRRKSSCDGEVNIDYSAHSV